VVAVPAGYHPEDHHHRYQRQRADIRTYRVPASSTGNCRTWHQLRTSGCSRHRRYAAIWSNFTLTFVLVMTVAVYASFTLYWLRSDDWRSIHWNVCMYKKINNARVLTA